MGENESVVVDANFESEDKIRVRMFEGLLGSDEFNEDFVSEAIVHDHGTATFTAKAGEYTVVVFADDELTGTAAIYVKSPEKEKG